MIKYALAGCAVLAMLLGVQSFRLDRVKGELRDAKQQIETLTAFAEAAKLDAQEQADQCTARVDEARASARRIETIIEREVPRDPQGCPVRILLTADGLRQALQPDAPTPEPVQ